MKVDVEIKFEENKGETLNQVYNVLDAYEKNFEVRGKKLKNRRIIIKKVECDLFYMLAQIPEIRMWA